MKLRTYRITMQFLIFVSLNLGLIISFHGFPLPVFYCHACPFATALCPLGAMEYAVIVSPILILYIFGVLSLFGGTFGRATCGWACPIGALQDLIGKKAKYRDVKKLRPFRYVKYILLILTLILSYLLSEKVFCDYCPIGFLTGTIPTLIIMPGFVEPLEPFFIIKIILTFGFFILVLSIVRGWCKYICPIGAQLSLFNKISLVKITYDESKCSFCYMCRRVCPMGIDPMRESDSPECIRCGRCVEICPQKALKFELRKPYVR